LPCSEVSKVTYGKREKDDEEQLNSKLDLYRKIIVMD